MFEKWTFNISLKHVKGQRTPGSAYERCLQKCKSRQPSRPDPGVLWWFTGLEKRFIACWFNFIAYNLNCFHTNWCLLVYAVFLWSRASGNLFPQKNLPDTVAFIFISSLQFSYKKEIKGITVLQSWSIRFS